MSNIIKSSIDIHGKLSIPIKIRRKLNLRPGDDVSLFVNENELIVKTYKSPLEKVRRLVNQYVSVSLLKELKNQRDIDAKKE